MRQNVADLIYVHYSRKRREPFKSTNKNKQNEKTYQQTTDVGAKESERNQLFSMGTSAFVSTESKEHRVRSRLFFSNRNAEVEVLGFEMEIGQVNLGWTLRSREERGSGCLRGPRRGGGAVRRDLAMVEASINWGSGVENEDRRGKMSVVVASDGILSITWYTHFILNDRDHSMEAGPFVLSDLDRLLVLSTGIRSEWLGGGHEVASRQERFVDSRRDVRHDGIKAWVQLGFNSGWAVNMGSTETQDYFWCLIFFHYIKLCIIHFERFLFFFSIMALIFVFFQIVFLFYIIS